MPRPPRFRLRPPSVDVSENDVKKGCLDLLRLNGWWPIRQHVGLFKTPDGRFVHMGVVGDPDYVIVKAPSFFLELKRPGGELRPEQSDRIFQLRQFYGLETLVVDGAEELMEWLNRQKRGP